MIIGIYKKARTNEFCEFAEYKIKKNTTVFLHTSNEQLETKINEINAIHIASIKYEQNKKSDFQIGLQHERTFLSKKTRRWPSGT